VIVPLRRVRKTVAAVFDGLGYQLRRKTPPSWGEDSFRDQAELLQGSPVETIFDVGANVGDSVARYRGLFPGATIHAFEPFPEVHRELSARFSKDPAIHAHRAAVTRAAGSATFHVNDVHVTNSLLPVNPAAAEWAGVADTARHHTIEVETFTLDGFCGARNITRIDLLKMDIQGGEAAALDGAARLLADRAVRLIYVEVLFAPLYEGQAYFCDISAILTKYGYRIFGLYDLKHGPRGLGWGDAIFRPS
jgi:FkbM family methyltransferase